MRRSAAGGTGAAAAANKEESMIWTLIPIALALIATACISISLSGRLWSSFLLLVMSLVGVGTSGMTMRAGLQTDNRLVTLGAILFGALNIALVAVYLTQLVRQEWQRPATGTTQRLVCGHSWEAYYELDLTQPAGIWYRRKCKVCGGGE